MSAEIWCWVQVCLHIPGIGRENLSLRVLPEKQHMPHEAGLLAQSVEYVQQSRLRPPIFLCVPVGVLGALTTNTMGIRLNALTCLLNLASSCRILYGSDPGHSSQDRTGTHQLRARFL